jgi:hypothetical protein
MASPWWDFFSHCKETAESDSEDEDDDRHENNDDTSYADNKNDGCVPNSADNTKQQQQLQMKFISEEEEDCEEHDDNNDKNTTTIAITNSNSDDDYYNNFIGEIEIMPISPLLSIHQCNIRKNAYNLLKRLGEDGSLFGMNSAEVVSVTEQDYDCDCEQQHRQKRQMELEEEVNDLKRQLGECTDIIVQLQDNLRGYSKDATTTNDDNDDDIASKGINDDEDDEGNKVDDEAEQLHAAIAELTSQLQSIMVQTTQDDQKIQILETQLQHALKESSHQSDKMQEYEETIDSLNKAMVQSSLYNEELVKELMILKKGSDDLKMRLMDVDKKREEEKEADNTAMPSLEGEANASPSIAATTGSAKDKALEVSFEDNVVDDGDDDATVLGSSPISFSSISTTTTINAARSSSIMHQTSSATGLRPILSLGHNNSPASRLDLLLYGCGYEY